MKVPVATAIYTALSDSLFFGLIGKVKKERKNTHINIPNRCDLWNTHA